MFRVAEDDMDRLPWKAVMNLKEECFAPRPLMSHLIPFGSNVTISRYGNAAIYVFDSTVIRRSRMLYLRVVRVCAGLVRPSGGSTSCGTIPGAT